MQKIIFKNPGLKTPDFCLCFYFDDIQLRSLIAGFIQNDIRDLRDRLLSQTILWSGHSNRDSVVSDVHHTIGEVLGDQQVFDL